MNPIPHSYIFLPPQCQWPSLFKQRMKELMEKEGDYIEQESDNEEDSNKDEDNIDSDNDDNDENGEY